MTRHFLSNNEKGEILGRINSGEIQKEQNISFAKEFNIIEEAFHQRSLQNREQSSLHKFFQPLLP